MIKEILDKKIIKIIMIFLFINSLIEINSSMVCCTNYYVAPNGSDLNEGSLIHPWATVQYAGRKAKPGDTIFIREGIYKEGEIWLRSEHGHGGKEGALVMIKNYRGEKPIFINGNRPFIIECDYILIEGLNFRNGKGISIRGLNRNTIQIKNNCFFGKGYAWGAIDSQGNNILIEGNECNLEGNIVGTQGHCFYISHGTNIILRNNIAKGASGYGIHIFDQRRSGDPPNYQRLIKNVIIEGNITANSRERSGIIIAAYDQAKIDNVIIRNNIIYENALNGISVRGNSRHIKIYNNTIYGNIGAAIYVVGDENDVGSVFIRNNIFDISHVLEKGKPTFHVVNENNNKRIILENNLYWPGPIRCKNIFDSSAIIGNPMFQNVPLRDFRLQRNSIAIDRGIELEDVSIDKDGVKRKLGSAYDIGAYECY